MKIENLPQAVAIAAQIDALRNNVTVLENMEDIIGGFLEISYKVNDDSIAGPPFTLLPAMIDKDALRESTLSKADREIARLLEEYELLDNQK